jgi:tetratricopeptide (TPR) repeat protein
LTKDWSEKTDHVRQFMIQLQKNVSPEAAAKSTLGDQRALEDALDTYVHKLSYLVARVDIPGKIDANDFTREPISEAESLAERGNMLVLVRRYDGAQRTFDQSIKADPKLAGGYEGMGFLYSIQKKYDDANKWFSQAVELNSEGTLANFLYATNLFKAHLDKETADKAEKSLRTAIRTDANFAPPYDALAYLLLTTSRGSEEAQRLSLQAITLEPGNIQYRLRMASVLIKLNQFDNAARVATLARSMARTISEENQADHVLESVRRMQEYSESNAETSGRVAQVQKPGQFEPPSASSDHPSGSGEASAGDGPGTPRLRHRDPGVDQQALVSKTGF